MEEERLSYINFLMDELHDSNTTIYELMVDEEYDELALVLEELVNKLIELKETIKDE